MRKTLHFLIQNAKTTKNKTPFHGNNRIQWLIFNAFFQDFDIEMVCNRNNEFKICHCIQNLAFLLNIWAGLAL